MTNMVVLGKVDLTSGNASEITFSDIPADYTDLYLVMSLRSAGPSSNFGIKLNGDTNFSGRSNYGNGSGAFSFSSVPNFIGVGNSTSQTANVFGSFDFHISQYTSSNNKRYLAEAVNENNATEAYQTIHAGTWNNTAAVTSITIYQLQGDNVGQYSSAVLYGISNS